MAAPAGATAGAGSGADWLVLLLLVLVLVVACWAWARGLASNRAARAARGNLKYDMEKMVPEGGGSFRFPDSKLPAPP
jgi:hypothetical protein